MSEPLAMYTVYCHPCDYPESYVVRRSWVGPELTVDPEPHAVVPTLDEARNAVPHGLIRLLRSPEDDPVIVEIWF